MPSWFIILLPFCLLDIQLIFIYVSATLCQITHTSLSCNLLRLSIKQTSVMKHRFDLTLACFYPAVKQRHKWKSWMWLHFFIYLFLTPTRPFPLVKFIRDSCQRSQCLIEHINMLFKSFLNCFCISHFEEGLKKTLSKFSLFMDTVTTAPNTTL